MTIRALLMLLCACASAAPAAPAAPVPPPPPPAAAPVAQPGLITDEECVARGGQVITQDTYAYLDRREPDGPRAPFRVCHVPSPKNGATCSGDEDCAGGRCFCAGALSRPDPENDPALVALDGTPGHGTCSDAPIPSGSWYCLVSDGKVNLQGIIVD